MTGLRLRREAPGDRPALLRVWTQAWTATFPEIDFEARLPWFEVHLTSLEMQGAVTTLAIDAAGLAGFSVFDPRSGEMDQLCVAPRAQGSGVADVLMNALKAQAPRVALTVNADNHRALRFYAREGFQVTGESLNPRSGLPIVAMEWRAATAPPS